MGYALVALGLTLIFGVLHVINFAHGEFYMLGGLAAVVGGLHLGLPYLLTLALVPVVVAIIGYGVERTTVGPVLHRPDGLSDALLGTYALSVLLGDAVLAVRGPSPERVEGIGGALELGGIVITHQRLFVFVFGLALVAAMQLLLRNSRFGRRIRAVAQSRFAAQVVGIDVRAVGIQTFMIGAAIGGLAGALLVPISQFTPGMGHNVIIKAFVVVVVGGMGSVMGAVVCGLALGVVEALLALVLPEGYATCLIYSLLLVTLFARPEGLFGGSRR